MSEVTTIKVSKVLRDRLRQRAAVEQVSLGAAIERLLEVAGRAERFERLRSERQSDRFGPDHDESLEQAALTDLRADPR